MATAADKKARIGVLGASGYTGAELVRLLLRHPQRRDRAAHRRPPRRAGDAPGVSAVLAVRAAEAASRSTASTGRAPALDLVFCALPHATTQKVIKRSAGKRCRRPRWSTSRPTSGSPTPPPMRAGTATSIMRPSCRRRRSTAWSRSIATRSSARGSSPIPAATPPAPQLPLIPLLRGQGDRSRRDRDRRQVRHDRRGQGGEGGDAVLRGVGRLPRLRRRPPPPHGRARPGVLQGRRPRGDRQLHAASGADEPRHPLDHLRARAQAARAEDLHAILAKAYAQRAVRARAAVRRRCRRPGMCAAPT